MIALDGPTSFQGQTRFDSSGAGWSAVLWEIPESRPGVLGVVVFTNCIFRDCVFKAIGVAGEKEMLDMFRQQLLDGG